MNKHENRLIHERSPYLLQHAHNPVDWYPWSGEAFKRAQNEDKPVFLSIGYSTCHWCHVMERESFEDEDVAEAMNRNFVCIKVDREERPDIDNFYMTASQMLTGSGGWPLNVIVTPDRKPLFAMTYIPRNSRGDRMGIIDLSNAIGELWKNNRKELVEKGEEIVSRLEKQPASAPGNLVDERFLNESFNELKDNYDVENGGFGIAPKFPTPHYMLFLIRYFLRTGERKALEMVEMTMRKMSLGGIYDQIGDGFHRYSTDAGWFLPHFEKMLYDQGMIMTVLAELYRVTHDSFYSDLISRIHDFLLRDLHSKSGGFYSAIDADSEGVEGKYYTWTLGEILKFLGDEDGRYYARLFNANSEGNFHDEATGRHTGRNVLYLDKELAEISEEEGISEDELKGRIESARKKLFEARTRRIPPATDTKIITATNGIIITALAKAYSATGNKQYLDLALQTADFILEKLDAGQDRLFHTYSEGVPSVEGFIDDYAYMVQALLDLYEATYDSSLLEKAIRLNDRTLTEFLDKTNFGFYFTAIYRNEIGNRRKEGYDGALPAGNSIQILNLLRLSQLLENDRLREVALKSINSEYETASRSTVFHLYLMCAVDLAIGPVIQIRIFSGKDQVSESMIAKAREKFNPLLSVLVINDSNRELLGKYTDISTEAAEKTSALVCRNFSCLPPVYTPEDLMAHIS
ncbi:MAG: thioredoxin domain-containing protein [Thermoplasmataceae archaeon]